MKTACTHRRRKVVAELGGALDDHRTRVVKCRECGAGFVITRWLAHDRSERRPMTQGELARYAPDGRLQVLPPFTVGVT